jgi:flagellar operon protein
MVNPIDRINPAAGGRTQPRPAKKPGSTGFDQALERMLRDRPPPPLEQQQPAESGEIKFSRHAEARLQSRGIELSEEDRQQLSSAFDQLADRGAKESLVLMGDRAYVVGVPKRTVITAMSRSEALGTIFTNIDSTFVAS